MLKNKIYKYLVSEIFKNFITILLTFTAIAWAVRAVNFLDLIVDDGYNSSIYFQYSLLNISTLITRFIPLAFLLALCISVVKFERQQELLILWTSGLNKLKIANIFLLIAFFVTLFQLILSLFVNPFLLNKSRSLLRDNEELQYNSILKSNDFSDNLKGVTFFIKDKNVKNELLNIFIKDTSGNLNILKVKTDNESRGSTIIAKKGYVSKDNLILFDGIIQTLNKKNEIKNIQFQKTELALNNLNTRIITQPKIQETSSGSLLKCVFIQKNLFLDNCPNAEFKKNALETISRRLGTPLYIPLISIIVSFLLIYKKEKKYNYLKKYILFSLSFLMLILAEILLKYAGFSWEAAFFYFILPVITFVFFYIYFKKKIIFEKNV